MPFTLSSELIGLVGVGTLLTTLARGPRVLSISEVTVASSVSEATVTTAEKTWPVSPVRRCKTGSEVTTVLSADWLSLSKMAATVRSCRRR